MYKIHINKLLLFGNFFTDDLEKALK